MHTTVVTVQKDIISIKVPIKIKRYGGKKMMILPEGAESTPPQQKPDETMVKALSKAFFWQKQIDQGQYRSIDDLASKKKINASYVSRILRLNLLAPQIKQAILDGTHPRGLSLQDMQSPFPDIWNEQLKHFGFISQS